MIKDAVASIERGIPLFIKNAFPRVLTVDEINNYLSNKPAITVDRLTHAFELENDIEWKKCYWDTNVNEVPVKAINGLLDQGQISIKECSRINKNINELCKEIESDGKYDADMHVFLDKNISSGLGVHKDSQNNIIIQIDGTTKWRVGSKIYNDSIRNLTKFYDEDILSIDVVMEPGDMIVIPKEMFHEAKSLTKRISASICFREHDIQYDRYDRNWFNWKGK